MVVGFKSIRVVFGALKVYSKGNIHWAMWGLCRVGVDSTLNPGGEIIIFMDHPPSSRVLMSIYIYIMACIYSQGHGCGKW